MTVTLAIEIVSAPPLRGRVRLEDGQWEPFVGWAALAVLVSGAAEAIGPPAAEPAP